MAPRRAGLAGRAKSNPMVMELNGNKISFEIGPAPSGQALMFSLHPTLAGDTCRIADLPLSRVLLMKDKGFPWLILVPKREGVREIHELTLDDRAILIEEVSLASMILTKLFNPVKINVGALGNIVPQLHIHVIARFENDRAWPGPVWGSTPKVPYSEEEIDSIVSRLKDAFSRS